MANASYIIMLFHHILWNVTLRLCLDSIFWRATNFHCWTTKCVPIRGLYYPSVNDALDIHVSVCLAAIPPAALISDQCFSANALCYSKLRLHLRTYLNHSNLLNGLNQCPTPIRRFRSILHFYAWIGSIYHAKKFWRLALRILHSFRHHSFSIHIHYCLCSSPNYILFGEQQTPNRLSSHSPLSKNIIIGKTDGYFKNGQLFSFWLILKGTS